MAGVDKVSPDIESPFNRLPFVLQACFLYAQEKVLAFMSEIYIGS